MSSGDGNGWVACDQGHRHWGRYGAAGLLLRSNGLVLLQHRSEHVANGSTWSIPGGARDSHESAREAALRETHEETGIPASDVAVVTEHVDDHGGWSYTTVVADARRAPADIPLTSNWEALELRWVPSAEVRDLLLHPGFGQAWPHLLVL